MDDLFLINERSSGEIFILDILGKVNGTWAQDLTEKLEELKDRGKSRVILNFQGATSIDDVGIEAIVSGLNIGLDVKIIQLNPFCREVFDRKGLADRVEVCCSEDDALRKYGATPVQQSLPEKRQHKRIKRDYPGEILYGNRKFRGVMCNVSESGALLGYIDSVEVPTPDGASQISDEVVQFLFRLRMMGDMQVVGDLVRFHPPDSDMNYMGIRFRHNENSRHLIKRICEDPPLSSLPIG